MSENTHQFINSTPINDLKSQEKPDTNQNSPKISLLHHMKKNAVPSGNTETTHHQISSVNIGGVLSRDAWYIFKESGQLDVDLLADVWPGEVINQSSTTPFTRAFKFNINLLSKSELQRLDVVHELISTEEDYVRDLGVVVDVFWGNARAMNVIGDADCDVIFSNLKEIRDVHLLWLDRFRARRKRDYGLIQQIGDLLIDMSEELKIYHKYCSNYIQAMRHIQHLTESSPNFSIFLNFCSLKPECRNMPISTFLLKPIQRICKYTLLIKEMCKYTQKNSTHSDHLSLQEALQRMEDVVKFVNRQKELSEDKQALSDCLAKLDFDSDFQLAENSNRALILEGHLLKLNSKSNITLSINRCVVLLNDCLVVAKVPLFSSSKPHVCGVYSVWGLSVSDLPDSEQHKFAFQVTIENKKHIQFAASSLSEKKKWLTGFKESLDRATKMLVSDTVKSQFKHSASESSLSGRIETVNQIKPKSILATKHASMFKSSSLTNISMSANVPPIADTQIQVPRKPQQMIQSHSASNLLEMQSGPVPQPNQAQTHDVEQRYVLTSGETLTSSAMSSPRRLRKYKIMESPQTLYGCLGPYTCHIPPTYFATHHIDEQSFVKDVESIRRIAALNNK